MENGRREKEKENGVSLGVPCPDPRFSIDSMEIPIFSFFERWQQNRTINLDG
jgi:hypothetical protein